MIFVVLGNYLNDDGTPSNILIERLNLVIEAYKKFHPTNIIVSGGRANIKTVYTESKVMKDYLINNGLDENIIIEENQSMTTKENAWYSSKIIQELNDKDVLVISSMEHFVSYSYNDVKYFTDVLPKGYNVMTYTKTKEV